MLDYYPLYVVFRSFSSGSQDDIAVADRFHGDRLDRSRQPVLSRSNHGPPQFVQPRPSRLVTPPTQNTLHAQSTGPVLLTRHPRKIARNHKTNDFLVPSKIVPAITVVLCPHRAHFRISLFKVHALSCPHAGQRNPAGQRRSNRHFRQAFSVENSRSISKRSRGYSPMSQTTTRCG